MSRWLSAAVRVVCDVRFVLLVLVVATQLVFDRL